MLYRILMIIFIVALGWHILSYFQKEIQTKTTVQDNSQQDKVLSKNSVDNNQHIENFSWKSYIKKHPMIIGIIGSCFIVVFFIIFTYTYFNRI